MDKQFQYFGGEAEIDTQCMRDIRATHASKAADGTVIREILAKRNEFRVKACHMFENDDVSENGLQELFGGDLTPEGIEMLLSEHKKMKTLFENGGALTPIYTSEEAQRSLP